MKVSAVSSYNYANKLKTVNSDRNKYLLMPMQNSSLDIVEFKGKGKKILGGLVGGAAGGAAGGAIIGGGTLAGAAALAASGPIGWGLVALYTVGGALAGGYVGTAFGESGGDKE